MDWRLFILTVLSLAWPGARALTVNIPNDVYEVARGDNITLPCTFVPKTKPSLVVITWTSSAEENVIITYYYSEKPTIDIVPEYEQRATLDVDVASGKANLKLSSLTLAENTVFKCRVQIPGDDKGKISDTARLVVLVAPSVPGCAIQGKAEYGQNINLTCKSEEGSPTPTYKWESRDVQNVPRVLTLEKPTEKDGILSLFNISKETSGYYICTAANKIRSTQCNLTLAVMPPSMSLGSTGTIAGIVAAIIGLIAIIIIIYCCRKKKQNADYAMGVHYDENHEEMEVKNVRQPNKEDNPADQRDRYDEDSEHNYDDRRSDYDDRKDRRNDYDDRKDRRSDYDDRKDRRSDYDDRRSDYNDRRRDYDDRRSDYDDRHDRYDDSYARRDDERGRERHYDDRRYYDDRESDRPRVPGNKPLRKNSDD